MNDCQTKTEERMRQPVERKVFNPITLMLAGVGMVLGTSLLGGCSSPPEAGPVPSKQEIQSDADRFFNTMEKEEAKKEAKESKP